MKEFQISKNAIRFLLEIMWEKRLKSPVRLDLSTGACSWLSFGLSFGKKKVNDVEYRSGDLTFLIDGALLQDSKPIRIDYIPDTPGAKFSIVSNLNLAATCWGCSTECKNKFTD